MAEALDDVARTKVIRSKDVAPHLVPRKVRVAVLDQRNVRGAAGVVFDADDIAWTRFGAHEVNDTDALLVSTTAGPDRDSTMVVPTATLAQGDSKLAERPAFPNVWREWPLEVANARGDGFVGFVENRSASQSCVHFVRCPLGRSSLRGIAARVGEGLREDSG